MRRLNSRTSAPVSRRIFHEGTRWSLAVRRTAETAQHLLGWNGTRDLDASDVCKSRSTATCNQAQLRPMLCLNHDLVGTPAGYRL
jgi:hypothetical protein